MTTKFINGQKLSIRPQNDAEKILFELLNAHLISGKKFNVKFENEDLILEMKSEK